MTFALLKSPRQGLGGRDDHSKYSTSTTQKRTKFGRYTRYMSKIRYLASSGSLLRLALPYHKICQKFLFFSDFATNFRISRDSRLVSYHFTTDSWISWYVASRNVIQRYPYHSKLLRSTWLLSMQTAAFYSHRTVRDGYGEALSNAHIWAFLVWRSFPHAQQTPIHQSLEPHCE